jgi:nucleotide-binding universal stress UspA family protein
VPRVLGIRRILVPLDFSKPAEKALRYAVSFAKQFDAKITLLHVCPVPYYGGDLGYIPASFPADQASEKAIADQLASDARRLVPTGMLDRTLVRVGSAFDEICNAARKLNSDLIIISTHGYTGLKHALLGSTAERVVRHAPCPVLVVRKHEREFA